MQMRLATSAAIGLTMLSLGIPPLSIPGAQAQVLASGTFTATRNCPAPRAINGANPSNIQVAPNQRYDVIGFNSQARKFLLLKVPGANPERRWVSAACGTFSSESGQSTSGGTQTTAPSRQSSTTLLPFFDQANNPEVHGFPRGQKVDITPPPPQLSAFDQAVLKTCGPIGTKVKASDFKQLMAAHPEVIRQIKQAVGNELLPGRRTEAEFLDDLTAVWSDRGSFEHIFCGELEGSQKIGGLHFVGRYLQLQNEKVGGRLPNNLAKEEVIPGLVYTLGVVVKKGGQTWTDNLKGYPLVSSAQDILLEVTQAFKAQGNAQGACIDTVRDPETGQSFRAVFVKDRKAIVTFYPDATPKGKPCRT